VLATPLSGETHPPGQIVWAQIQRSIQTAEDDASTTGYADDH